MDEKAAAEWLGVTLKTYKRYETEGTKVPVWVSRLMKIRAGYVDWLTTKQPIRITNQGVQFMDLEEVYPWDWLHSWWIDRQRLADYDRQKHAPCQYLFEFGTQTVGI